MEKNQDPVKKLQFCVMGIVHFAKSNISSNCIFLVVVDLCSGHNSQDDFIFLRGVASNSLPHRERKERERERRERARESAKLDKRSSSGARGRWMMSTAADPSE